MLYIFGIENEKENIWYVMNDLFLDNIIKYEYGLCMVCIVIKMILVFWILIVYIMLY